MYLVKHLYVPEETRFAKYLWKLDGCLSCLQSLSSLSRADATKLSHGSHQDKREDVWETAAPVISDNQQFGSPWVTIDCRYSLLPLKCLVYVKGVRVPRNGMGSPLECTMWCIFRLKQRRQNLVAEMEHLSKQRDWGMSEADGKDEITEALRC